MHPAPAHASDTPDRAAPALEIDRLHVAYGEGVQALAGVSLRVDRGEIVALLGANGAGKTSLVRAVTGVLPFYSGRIQSGSIRLLGETAPSRTADLVRTGLSQVMEGRRVFADLTVADNLRAGGVTCGKRDAAQRYDQVIDRFPALKRREHTAAGYLSGGEQQMLAIGRALMQAPRVLLMDEPTLGLAPSVVGQIRDLVVELNARGTTIMLIEQNVAMALDVSRRAYVIERGRIVREGPSEDLAADDAIRQAYLGISAVAP